MPPSADHSRFHLANTVRPATEQTKAESRRSQIRDAAAKCFAEQGFHGTSIAQISKVCGMSTGHIYHYFQNKEAIIQAIVADKVHQLLLNTEQARQAPDVVATMLAGTPGGVTRHMDPLDNALQLEILAEASRNQAVLEMVQQADALVRPSLFETIRRARQDMGFQDDDTHTQMLTDGLSLLFEGLRIRALRNPGLNAKTMSDLLQHLIKVLLTTPGSGTAS